MTASLPIPAERRSLSVPPYDTAGAVAVEVIEGPDAVLRLGSEWAALDKVGAVATPFQSYAVAQASAQAHVRRGETPRIAVARRAGRPVALIPLVICSALGLRVLRFLGDPLVQYGDMLAAPDVREAEIAAAWTRAVDVPVATLALLRRVRDDAHCAGRLADSAGAICSEQTALLDLDAVHTPNARTARESRRLRRRLAEQGPVTTRFFTGSEAETPLKQALALKSAWLKTHGLASAVIGDADWEQALCDVARAGALTVAELSVADNPAALEVALTDSGCWYGFLGVFDMRLARMGPGQLLTADCVDTARAAGLACYDQLPPAHAYKCRQATRMLSVRDYALPLGPAGRLAALAARLTPEIKAIFRALPSELRRPLVALAGR